MKRRKALSALLCLMLLVGLIPTAAFAAESGTYVLMNIPYADFYRAELGEGAAAVDAVTSATKNKTRTGTLAGGSYHEDAGGSDISGVIYPVLVTDAGLLDSLTKVDDSTKVEITVANRGQETTTVYEGADALFESPAYAYYLLAETPEYYKTLSLENGVPVFSEIHGTVRTAEGASGAVTYNGRHTDIEIKLSGTEGIAQGDTVSAVVLTASDGAKYGLRHVVNIWRAVELGWEPEEPMAALAGSSITNIRYITRDAVIDYPVSIAVDERGESGFTDIADDAWYAPAVAWAVEKGVISNRGNGHFDAEAQISRGDFITYLWNAAGKPEPETAANPFTDVSEDAAYYKAVLWAVENGVTDGTGGDTFSPDNGIDRAQLVTFLWKKAGKPAPEAGKAPFSDASARDWYYEAVAWAAENGVTDGMGNGAFSPAAIVDRAQIVAFLYKNAITFTDDFGIFPEIAGENGTTYENLFEVILTEAWYQTWFDSIAPIAGEENTAETLSYLQGAISSELYGAAAIEAFGDGSGDVAFDCWYINGARTFTFKDDTVTIVTEDGASQTHTYKYLGQYDIGEGESMSYMGQEISVALPCDVYESTDEAGEFNYFFLLGDTMEETYHIEFRYGRDLKALQGYFVGPYAYWLAAGIDVEADEETIEDVIELFCLENMDYSAHTDAALSQLDELGFLGTWVADLSAFGEEYAGISLYFTIDENGRGITKMNGFQTADFEAYAYDNGEKGDGRGIYVAYSNLEYEAEAAVYTLETDADGNTVLTFYSDDGVISYVKAESFAGGSGTEADPWLIETAGQLDAVRYDLSASYRLNADIDLDGISWIPLGTFVPSGETEEEAELPAADYAFSGRFDGNGHTISNLRIDQPEGYALGLFGCVSEAQISDLTVENAAVDGSMMVGAVVGYSFDSTISGVNLTGENTVTGHVGAYGYVDMVGGIVGAGMDSVIRDCSAAADIVIPDGGRDAGIVGGGLEVTSVIRCTATGSVTAGNGCYGVGGVAGCGFGAEEFTGCTAEDVRLALGDDAYLVGGIVGYAGGYEDGYMDANVTEISGCAAKNVAITARAGGSAIGGIIGNGFYFPDYAAMDAHFEAPTVFHVTDCASDTTLNGETIAEISTIAA